MQLGATSKPLIPALARLRWVDRYKFEPSLVYKLRSRTAMVMS